MEKLGIKNREGFIRKMVMDGYIINIDTNPTAELVRLIRNSTGNIPLQACVLCCNTYIACTYTAIPLWRAVYVGFVLLSGNAIGMILGVW